MTIDIMNPNSSSFNGDTTEVYVDFAFSPLFHFGTPQVEFVVGPKLGFFAESATITNSSSPDYQYSGTGLAYGLNAGVFIPLGRVAIGGLFNFTGHHYSSACTNDNTTNYVQQCGDVPSGNVDTKILGFTGALLY